MFSTLYFKDIRFGALLATQPPSEPINLLLVVNKGFWVDGVTDLQFKASFNNKEARCVRMRASLCSAGGICFDTATDTLCQY